MDLVICSFGHIENLWAILIWVVFLGLVDYCVVHIYQQMAFINECGDGVEHFLLCSETKM